MTSLNDMVWNANSESGNVQTCVMDSSCMVGLCMIAFYDGVIVGTGGTGGGTVTGDEKPLDGKDWF